MHGDQGSDRRDQKVVSYHEFSKCQAGLEREKAKTGTPTFINGNDGDELVGEVQPWESA